MATKKKEEVKIEIPDIAFIAKDGTKASVKNILTSDDYWTHKKGDAWIISHKGVEKLAAIGGIKPQINTRFELEVSPTYQNAMNHQVVANMICETELKANVGTLEEPDLQIVPDKCAHGTDQTFFSSGEAARYNTGARGGSYLRLMADKRAYDRGVLRHLGLDNGLNIYSEEEAEAFEQDKVKPTNEIIEKLSPYLNGIVNAKSVAELKPLAQSIKVEVIDEADLEFLRKKFKQRLVELSTNDF